MNTIQEILAWAGIASALALIAGIWLGHRVGWRNAYHNGECNGMAMERAAHIRYLSNMQATKQYKLAAERAKRDSRGRYKKAGAV